MDMRLGPILEQLRLNQGLFHTALADLTAAELDGKLVAPYPVQEPTVVNGIAFLTFHETFHIGQLGYIRKLRGYQTLAG